jgi:MIP family channel proteins
MRDSWRHFVAEFVGIFALVFVGGASIISSAMSPTGVVNGLIVAALAHGLILALMVSATMRISGHLNPAVTIGFLVTKRIEPVMAVIYIIAQILGATLAAYALTALFPHDAVVATHAGGQALAGDVSVAQGIAMEAIATFFLVFVVFGTAVDPAAPKVGGFAIGLTVAADIFAIGMRTGGSMNPARSFGPAVVMQAFDNHLVYWIGPIIGGIAAALLYDGLFLRRGREPQSHGPVDPK